MPKKEIPADVRLVRKLLGLGKKKRPEIQPEQSNDSEAQGLLGSQRIHAQAEARISSPGSDIRFKVSLEVALGKKSDEEFNYKEYDEALNMDPTKRKALLMGIPESHPNFNAVLLTLRRNPEIDIKLLRQMHRIAEWDVNLNKENLESEKREVI